MVGFISLSSLGDATKLRFESVNSFEVLASWCLLLASKLDRDCCDLLRIDNEGSFKDAVSSDLFSLAGFWSLLEGIAIEEKLEAEHSNLRQDLTN